MNPLTQIFICSGYILDTQIFTIKIHQMDNLWGNISKALKIYRRGGGTKLEAEKERIKRELNRSRTEVSSLQILEDEPHAEDRIYNNLLLTFSVLFGIFSVSCSVIFLVFHFWYKDDIYKYFILAFICVSTSLCSGCIFLMCRRLRRIWKNIVSEIKGIDIPDEFREFYEQALL